MYYDQFSVKTPGQNKKDMNLSNQNISPEIVEKQVIQHKLKT